MTILKQYLFIWEYVIVFHDFIIKNIMKYFIQMLITFNLNKMSINLFKNIIKTNIFYINSNTPSEFLHIKNINYCNLVSLQTENYNNTILKCVGIFNNLHYIDINFQLLNNNKNISYYTFDTSGHIKYDNIIIEDDNLIREELN